VVFVVIREHGPSWDASRPLHEQDGWPEHAAFMEALVDDGFASSAARSATASARS
jgi:hypothetical protein